MECVWGVERESCNCVIAAVGALMNVRNRDRELSGRGTGVGVTDLDPSLP